MDIFDQVLNEPEPPARPQTYDQKWSSFQTNIFDAVHQPGLNLLVSAGAGSGKSTTLVKAMSYAPGTSLFMAFNKSIADELREKVGSSGEVKTLNALGHRVLTRQLGRSAELDARKVSQILRRLMGEGNELYREYGYQLSRTVGLMKNNAFGLLKPIELQDVVDLMDSYGLDIPSDQLHTLASYVLRAFQCSINELKSFDFDDQLYLPLLMGLSFPFYSNVFVDECQDLSPIQHMMLDRLASEGSRIVAVGDRFQAIYGFRGALTDSMDRLKTRFSMTELPLSISYRCGYKIVEAAGPFCDFSLHPRPAAPPGYVYTNLEDPHLFSDTLVLCRNNAPLFKAILRHIRAKSPCRVLSNFVETFSAFIRGFKVKRTSELLVKLEEWFEKEVSAAEKRGFRGKLAALGDKYETTKLLAQEFAWTDDMVECVERLALGRTGPIFSTVHKAKGLEHENVYILRPDLMPSPFATTADAKRQELNLIYVAITRAKLNLGWGVSET